MNKLLLIITLFIIANYILFSKNNFNSAYQSNPQPFDVLKYDLEFNIIDFNKKLVNGINTITLYWKDNDTTNKFFFMLEDLSVDSIFYDGIKVDYSLNYPNNYFLRHFSINRINSKDTTLIKIYYSGNMTNERGNFNWGGVHIENNVLYNLGVSFSEPQISAAKFWMPCYDHPSDKALFEGKFTIKDSSISKNNYYTVSNGLLAFQQITEDARIDKFIQSFPSATYLLNFAISEFFEYKNYSKDSLLIVAYSSKSDSNFTKLFYQNVEEMKNCFEYYFTPYPFEKIGYVNAEKGAMEHQTLITMPRRTVVNSAQGGNYYNTTAAHELAHSWFGNSVTPSDFRDVWFNEAFATFCEALWQQYLLDNKLTPYTVPFSSKIYQDWMYYLNNSIPLDDIISLYNFKKYDSLTNNIKIEVSNYPTTIYYKGSVIVQLLMYELGMDNFFDATKQILNKYKYGNINTLQIKNEYEKASGKNLDLFFNQWIYQAGFPILDIKYEVLDNQVKLYIEQVQDTAIYGSYTDILLPVNYVINDRNNLRYYKINDKYQVIVDTLYDTSKLDYIQINSRFGWISPIQYKLSKITNIIEKNTTLRVIETTNNIIIQNIPNSNLNYCQVYDIFGNLINADIIRYHNDIIINKSNLVTGNYFVRIADEVIKFLIVK